MPLLEWKPSYTLGIPSVDTEHRELIRVINSVYEQLETGVEPQSITEVLGEIHARISAHFALEEQLMRSAHYAEYADHKDSHEELLDQVRDLMDRYSDDPVSGKTLLQNRLADWFGVHFATFDARLHLKIPH